jgi:polysaccharide export outer membrane protein
MGLRWRSHVQTDPKFEIKFMRQFKYLLYLFVIALMAGSNSCTTPKEFVYLSDLNEAKDSLIGPMTPFREQYIVPDDMLHVQVSALNPEDVQMFDITGMGSQGNMMMSQNFPQIMGYIVDKRGMVTLPYIGDFNAAGLTLREMEIFVTEKLKRYVKEPVVRIRFLNHMVTILGEVQAPRQIPMNYERLTLAEALGMVGDLKYTGYADNILVVREENGVRTSGRVDLRSKTVFNNPYYYLANRDLVYVEPVQAAYVNRGDKTGKYLNTYVAAGATLLSLLISVIAITR